MQLPEILLPWRRWLEWFAPEQLPLFADLLGRLNPLLGPSRGLQEGGNPEPDGLGDLQRRGPYDRLLSSEWLLADEVPEEFLRRAIVGEHIFLTPQYRARRANRLLVALFDAGPLQFGAARLVHLALLLLLARRAEEAGTELRWGILQHVPQLYEFNNSAQLRSLLNARTYQVVTDEHWQVWRTWLAEQQQAAGECWMVGARAPKAESPSCSHRVQIRRSLDGQSLTVEMQAGSNRCVKLPIPDERLALQLLKGHFDGERELAAPAKGDVPRVALTLPPVISSAGTHVALKLLDDPGMAVVKLPGINQKKALEVRSNLWGGRCAPLTVTFIGRSVGAVLSDDAYLSFWNMPGLKSVSKPGREELQLALGTATHLPAAWLRSAREGRLFLLDPQGRLAFWAVPTGRHPAQPKTGVTHRLTDGVMGLAKVESNVVAYVRKDGNRLCAHTVGADGVVAISHAIGVFEGQSQVLFAHAAMWRRSFGGCALLHNDNGCQSWQVIPGTGTPQQLERIKLDLGWKGFGLLWEDADWQYSLLLIAPNQQTIVLYGGGQQQVLFTTSQTIAKVSFCPASGLVAVLTSARELLVYSIPQRTMRLQVFCNRIGKVSRKNANARA